MLEKYEENFNADKYLKELMAGKSLNRTLALRLCRKEIPRETYYQDKIKKALRKRYRGAFVRKIAQGMYSEGGTPDVMCIIDGHYFGFEIKRPLLGETSRLQEACIRGIEAAGGTAAVVSWPEECFQIIDKWKAWRE